MSAVCNPDRVRAWREKLLAVSIELTEHQAAELRRFTNGGFRRELLRAA